ncbi:MAG: IS4/IS5 family transposase [Rhodanobacter sp.]|nr:MAG: IS4/IS5 family transposase [Rhodanobacter sp.]
MVVVHDGYLRKVGRGVRHLIEPPGRPKDSRDSCVPHAAIKRLPREVAAQPPAGRPRKRDGPEPFKRAQKDVDARWTKKHGKSHYGYKLHANTDRRWGFIRKVDVTSASVNDTEVFESILDEANTHKDVYADRGYAKHARETELYVQGYRANIQRKGTRAELERAESELQDAQDAMRPAPAVTMLPRLRERWDAMVKVLAQRAQNLPAAREAIRELLGERITVRNENGDLFAEIAASDCQLKLVAGAGFEPATFGL